MAEEVQIGNVGGEGVASEVTLARLTATMELMAKKKGVNPAEITKKMNQVMNESSKYIKDNTESKKDNTKETDKATEAVKRFATIAGGIGYAFGTLTSSVTGLADSLLNGGEALGDFTKHIPLIGSYLSPLVAIIDQNIDSFRSLSNVGATFGDGLNDIRRISANAGIPLGEFTDLVAENSQRMRFFGGSVASGSTAFAAMSKQLRDGPGRRFMNLGYTAQELNESLIDYAEFNATQMGSQRIQNRMSAQGASEYLQVIDDLARVSGKRRDQIKEEMNAAQSDQRIRAATSSMTTTQAANFNAALAQVATDAPQVREALIDMADGFANDPLTALLNENSATFKRSAKDIENMNAAERNNFFAEVGREMDLYAEGLGASLQGVIRAGGDAGDLAGIGAGLRNFQEMTTAQIEAMNDAAAAEQQRLDGMKGFSDTLRDIRTGFMTLLTNPGEIDPATGEATESILQQVTRYLNEFASTLRDFVKSPAFTTGIKDISDGISTFITDWKNLGFIEAFSNVWDKLWKEDGPLMKAMNTAFEWIKTNVGPLISDAFSSMISGVFDALTPDWDTLIAGALGGLAAVAATAFLGIPSLIVAPIIGAIAAIVGWELIEETVKGWITDIKSFFTGIADWWKNLSITEMIGDAWNAVTGIFTGIGDWWSNLSITTMLSDAWTTITSFFSFEGFQIPSISGMFQGILDRVRSFFSFDFQLPSFKSFLPTWLGGEGRTLDDSAPAQASATSTSAPAQVSVPDPSQAIATGTALVDANSAMAQFANLPDLQRNLDAIRNGLDVNNVRSYTEAIDALVESLNKLNEELSQDNDTMFTSRADAGELLSGISTSTSGTSQGTQQLNSTMQQVLIVLSQILEIDNEVERNTRNIIGSNLAYGGVSNVAR